MRKAQKPMTVATRSVTLRDYLIFMVKLLLDAGRDAVVVPVATVAVVLDFIAGDGDRPRLLYSVMRISEKWDLWLNLHAPVTAAGESDDGLFGASKAGVDTYLGQIEKLVRGGDGPGAGGQRTAGRGAAGGAARGSAGGDAAGPGRGGADEPVRPGAGDAAWSDGPRQDARPGPSGDEMAP